MKSIVTVFVSGLILVGCGDTVRRTIVEQGPGALACTQVDATTIECNDGTTIDLDEGIQGLPGKDGKDGQDGIDGQDGAQGPQGEQGEQGVAGQNGSDGQDAVLLTKVNLPKNSCTQVYDGIYAQNLLGGDVFDIYLTPDCKDKNGEYCDNVVPVGSSVGSVEPYNGSGTVCWADNLQISGVAQGNGDILVHILDFNE